MASVPADEVIVPSLTFAATANAVALTGATPVFAEIEPRHFCLDPASVAAAINSSFGRHHARSPLWHPADMDALGELTARHGLAILEDACQSHSPPGAVNRLAPSGDLPPLASTPRRNMTTGEGGMVVCSDEQQAHRVRLLRNHGMERKYENEVIGFNTRMTDVAAPSAGCSSRSFRR